MKHPSSRFCALFLWAALSIAGCERQPPGLSTPAMQASQVRLPRADFTGLTDHHGNKVPPGAYQDKILLIFGGFTTCPLICTPQVEKIHQVLESLPRSERRRIQPLFISVIPDQEPPAQIAAFLKTENPFMTGLTGDPVKIRAILDAYGITMANHHAAFSIAQDTNGNTMVFQGAMTQEDYTRNLRQFLAQHDGNQPAPAR